MLGGGGGVHTCVHTCFSLIKDLNKITYVNTMYMTVSPSQWIFDIVSMTKLLWHVWSKIDIFKKGKHIEFRKYHQVNSTNMDQLLSAVSL